MTAAGSVAFLLETFLSPLVGTPSGPNARAHHASVYHEGQGTTYLIGGGTRRDSGYHYFDDVWTWNGTRWTEIGQTFVSLRLSHQWAPHHAPAGATFAGHLHGLITCTFASPPAPFCADRLFPCS